MYGERAALAFYSVWKRGHKGLDHGTLNEKWSYYGQPRFGRIKEFSVSTHRGLGEAKITEKHESTVLVH